MWKKSMAAKPPTAGRMKISGATDFNFSRVMEWNRICAAPVSRSKVFGARAPGRRFGSPVTSTATVMSARSITTSYGTGLM